MLIKGRLVYGSIHISIHAIRTEVLWKECLTLWMPRRNRSWKLYCWPFVFLMWWWSFSLHLNVRLRLCLETSANQSDASQASLTCRQPAPSPSAGVSFAPRCVAGPAAGRRLPAPLPPQVLCRWTRSSPLSSPPPSPPVLLPPAAPECAASPGRAPGNTETFQLHPKHSALNTLLSNLGLMWWRHVSLMTLTGSWVTFNWSSALAG